MVNIGETNTIRLNYRDTNTCERSIGEVDTTIRDSGSKDTTRNRNGSGNGNENGYNSEDIKEMFNVEWLINEDDKEFRFIKQKVNANVRRRGKDPSQNTQSSDEGDAIGREV